MRKLLIVLIIASTSCDLFLQDNDEYCDSDARCTEPGTRCNLKIHRCAALTELTLTAATPPTAPNKARVSMPNTITLSGTGFAAGMSVSINGLPALSVDVS